MINLVAKERVELTWHFIVALLVTLWPFIFLSHQSTLQESALIECSRIAYTTTDFCISQMKSTHPSTGFLLTPFAISGGTLWLMWIANSRTYLNTAIGPLDRTTAVLSSLATAFFVAVYCWANYLVFTKPIEELFPNKLVIDAINLSTLSLFPWLAIIYFFISTGRGTMPLSSIKRSASLCAILILATLVIVALRMSSI